MLWNLVRSRRKRHYELYNLRVVQPNQKPRSGEGDLAEAGMLAADKVCYQLAPEKMSASTLII